MAVAEDFFVRRDRFLDAARSGDVHTVKGMLDDGFPADAIDDDRTTALQIASAIGHFHMMVALLRSGATVDKCNDIGFTPFLHACRNGNLVAVELLLRHGADHLHSTFYGVNGITLASAGGHLELVSRLQRASALPKRTSPSPLIAAVAKRQFDIVIFFQLLRNPPRIFDSGLFYGKDVVQLASSLRDEQMCELLADLGVKLDGPSTLKRRFPSAESSDFTFVSSSKTISPTLADIRCFIRDEKVRQLERMLKLKRRFAPLPKGTTPLMFAAVTGNVRMAKVLLKYGEDINASAQCFTPLMIAIVCGNDAFSRYLLRAGAVLKSGYHFSVSQLAASSSGISDSTRNLINETGSLRVAHKKPLGHFVDLLCRKNVHEESGVWSSLNGAPGKVSFAQRVALNMGKLMSMVPQRLFDLLSFPDSSSRSTEGDVPFVNPDGDGSPRKFDRVLDAYSKEDIEGLFRRANAPVFSRRRQLPSRAVQEAMRIYSVTRSSSSPVSVPHFHRLLNPEARARSVSELRSVVFRVDRTANQSDGGSDSAFVGDRSPSGRLNGDFLGCLRTLCSSPLYRALVAEEVDSESFLLLLHTDFEQFGASHTEMLALNDFRKELIAKRRRSPA